MLPSLVAEGAELVTRHRSSVLLHPGASRGETSVREGKPRYGRAEKEAGDQSADHSRQDDVWFALVVPVSVT
jgi:hypothetical protein